jgi:acyl transferase domain-containing protein
VTGELVVKAPDAAYWLINMVSPVRFAQATTVLLNDSEAPNFLVEVGPANALAGPVSQIKKSLSGAAADSQYVSALKRGAQAIIPLFEVAGRLFLSSASPNLKAVSSVSSTRRPAVIVDIPNYAWNHSTRYWHETTASKDWRFKKFILHDLLGSKMIGTPWNAPTFKRTLKLGDLTWLKDHKLGAQIVFPGAGYVAMAIEAIYQTAFMTTWKEEVPDRFRYRLRDVKFSRAIVIEEDAEIRIMLTLTPVPGSTRSWYEFKIYSLREQAWTEHSTGLIRVETDYKDEVTPPSAIGPLKYPTPGRAWYKAMAEAGYNFGDSFRNHLMVESMTGQRKSRSTVSLKPPPSSYGQSFYPMHPACIDGCFQTVSPALWKGDRTDVGAVLVPSVLSSLVISGGRTELPEEAISVASAHWLGLGRTDAPRNYGTNCSVYDPNDGALLLEMKDLKFAELETSEEEGPGHTFTQMSWDADISMLFSVRDSKLQQVLKERSRLFKALDDTSMTKQEILIHELPDLVAHKNPILEVAEVNVDPEDASSLWLQRPGPKRAACSLYHFASTDSSTVVKFQEKFSPAAPNAGFTWFDLANAEPILADTKFDLILAKILQGISEDALNVAIDSIVASSQDDGLVLVAASSDTSTQAALESIGTVYTPNDDLYAVQLSNAETVEQPAQPIVSLVSLSGEEPSTELIESLEGWNIQTGQEINEIETNQTVLVVDELSSSVMDRLDEYSWNILQELVQKETKFLWVTTGAQLEVTESSKAAINGFCRVLRAEEPLLHLITLDVESPHGDATITAINSCLELISKPKPKPKPKQQVDSEFVERNGILHVSRVIPEEHLTRYQGDELSSLKTEVIDLHASMTPIRLRVERLGNIDTIHYGEISPVFPALARGHLEVEIYAAGMNYKDVVVSMGIVPGNEHTLGGEGAGIVTRISPGMKDFKVG